MESLPAKIDESSMILVYQSTLHTHALINENIYTIVEYLENSHIEAPRWVNSRKSTKNMPGASLRIGAFNFQQLRIIIDNI